VLQAQRLLETSEYSVDEVAGRCGFRSPVALRGHFRRQLGSSPAAYRAAYRARRPQGERGERPERASDRSDRGPDRSDRGPDRSPDRPDPSGETVVPPQHRRVAAANGPAAPGATASTGTSTGLTAAAPAELGKPTSDAYAPGRVTLPGTLPGRR
jgi:hypothetical protein